MRDLFSAPAAPPRSGPVPLAGSGPAAPAPAAPAPAERWPLTPIEELEVYLENRHEPSLVQLETHTGCQLDRQALAAALGQVLAADPAAGRRQAATSRWGRHLYWQPGPGAGSGPLTVARWDSPGELAALRERVSAWPMPLSGAALRLILAAGPGHDAVILQTHHAAFDGVSSLALLRAVCAAYRDRVGGRGPAAAPPPAAAPGSQPCPPAGQSPAARRRSRPGRGPLPGMTTRICAQAAAPGRPGYGYVLRSLPVPRPAREGSGPHPTVNDVLVAALILTVERWNTGHGRRSGRISITVPVNVREPERRWEGPGNQSRLIRVTARPRQRVSPADLLGQVTAQTRARKQQAWPGQDAVSRLLATGWAPAAVKRRTTRLARRLAQPVCTDTSLVSNLGVVPDPPSFSGTGGEPLWFSGPAPMPRGLCVGAVTVAGQLHLCIHYRHALLDQAAAEEFTAAYCQAVTGLAALPAGRLP